MNNDVTVVSTNATDLAGLIDGALRAAEQNAPAVVERARVMSYGELNTLSHTLADKLSDDSGPVGIPFTRGCSAIITIVGCIRSGRPFVPIRDDSTTRRVGLDGVTLTAIITRSSSAVTQREDLEVHRLSPCATVCPPSDLGYLLPTSGTTGPPKFVRGSSHALARYLHWQNSEVLIGPGDVVSNSAQPWFDFAFKETLAALIAGATIHVMPETALLNGDEMLSWTVKTQPAMMCLLPSRLSLLIAAIERAGTGNTRADSALQRLRWLLVSGEAFPRRLYERLRSIAPAPTVLNLYGPTEATVIKLRHVLPPGTTVATPTVPVGTPIPGASIELLPHSGDPSAGELCIISDDLALGYSGAPSDRFGVGNDGRRRLRTGDLARVLDDGVVELLGRTDHVVKRHGQKVSLSAIETAAQTLPTVDSAAAVDLDVQTDTPCTRTAIVLFCVTPDAAPTTQIGDLRADLLSLLDLGAMPDHIRLLPALPLTPGGKICRETLRELVGALSSC